MAAPVAGVAISAAPETAARPGPRAAVGPVVPTALQVLTAPRSPDRRVTVVPVVRAMTPPPIRPQLAEPAAVTVALVGPAVRSAPVGPVVPVVVVLRVRGPTAPAASAVTVVPVVVVVRCRVPVVSAAPVVPAVTGRVVVGVSMVLMRR